MYKTIKIELTDKEQEIFEDAIRIARKNFRDLDNKKDEKVLLEIRRKIYSKQRKFSDDYIYGN